MKLVRRLSDRMLSVFVPQATAAAASAQECWNERECRNCGGATFFKFCWSQWCDGQYVSGGCGRCGYC